MEQDVTGAGRLPRLVRPVARALWPRRDGLRRRLAYAALSVPLGAAYLGLFSGLVLGVVTVPQVVGVFLILAVLASARTFGGLERRLSRSMLHVELADGVRLRRLPGVVRRVRALVLSSSTWRNLAWLGVRVLLAAGVVATVVSWVGLAIVLVTAPDWSFGGFADVGEVAALLLIVFLAGVAVRLLDLEVQVITAVAAPLQGVSAQERIEALRQASQRLAGRNSVARDLHDTIGHTLTASLLQAGAARRSLAPDPDAPERPVDPAVARQALTHIENNTRAALAELERALAVLGDRTRAGSADTDLAAPDLRDVADLVAGLQDGGLPVSLVIDVEHDSLSAPVSQLVYRIVQEGTTNVMRHAGSASTVVEVQGAGQDVTVRVHNAESSATDSRPGPGGGHGVHGLRQRVEALGGRLLAGPTPTGGFELLGELPMRDPHG